MITQEFIKEILSYCPETGVFTWKINRRGNAKAGSLAGSVSSNGYVLISVKNRHYSAHRLAFLYMTGRMPKALIDHVNRIKTDNRWANLREATKVENGYNAGLRSDNKSGVKGVHWNKQTNKWRVTIRLNKKRIYLGLYDELSLAAAAYSSAARIAQGEFALLSEAAA